ncbi:hypothetical protein B9Z55_026310 [Caenorhabditis nigoni]|uniref:DUF7747 domain-containing protein n=1 Tax=Caenorhabditis nigoni TaxID=1611254 RepID=A0A2G5T323_9PELO|nr:hypothetical protein B9Z55_026310 [Caenorhabditis nigoni]
MPPKLKLKAAMVNRSQRKENDEESCSKENASSSQPKPAVPTTSETAKPVQKSQKRCQKGTQGASSSSTSKKKPLSARLPPTTSSHVAESSTSTLLSLPSRITSNGSNEESDGHKETPTEDKKPPVAVHKTEPATKTTKLSRENENNASLSRLTPDFNIRIAKTLPHREIQTLHLFYPEIKSTPEGLRYATVSEKHLGELLKKDRILNLLTNDVERDQVRRVGWLSNKKPHLPPPNTNQQETFAFFVTAHGYYTRLMLGDGVQSWAPIQDSTSKNPSEFKRFAVVKNGKNFELESNPALPTCLKLTEYHVRCSENPRLEKRIYYLSGTDDVIIKNVLYFYSFNYAEKEDVENRSPKFADSPFENEQFTGKPGGVYLKLKNSLLDAARNYQSLIKYMIPDSEHAKQVADLNKDPPDLPPLIETAGTFVYFVPSELANLEYIAKDGLSPWSPIYEKENPEQLYGRVLHTDGNLLVSGKQDSMLESLVYETNWKLERCPRIHKKILSILPPLNKLGNACIIYIYNDNGPFPKEEETEAKIPIHVKIRNLSPEVLESIDECKRLGYPDMSTDSERNTVELATKPFSSTIRCLSTGHLYLKVLDKDLVGDYLNVLKWISNSTLVTDIGILNRSTPPHPPMVVDSQAYAFFVDGTAIVPNVIPYDAFSPWSRNSNDNGTTTFKFGVVQDPKTFVFKFSPPNSSDAPYNLVVISSKHHKYNRLTRKIFYIVSVESQSVVSHALVLYNYTEDGPIVKFNALPCDYDNSQSADTSIQSQAYPFLPNPQTMADGSICFEVEDFSFWNDVNRQLQYMHNESWKISLCVNQAAPDLPPLTTRKSMFAFFVRVKRTNLHLLTIDKLDPWVDNAYSGEYTIPSRTEIIPLKSTTPNNLEVDESENNQAMHHMSIHTTILSRCSRLRKKVIYLRKGASTMGYALILYYYTDKGVEPQPLHTSKSLKWFHSLDDHIQHDLRTWIGNMNTLEIIRELNTKYGIKAASSEICSLKSQLSRRDQDVIDSWTNTDGTGPSTSAPRAKFGNFMKANDMDVVYEEDVQDDDHVEIECHSNQDREFCEENIILYQISNEQEYYEKWNPEQEEFEFDDSQPGPSGYY